MIQWFGMFTANPTFRNSVLPRTAICGPNGLATHCLRSGDDIPTELCVPIEDQKALQLLVPRPRLVQPQPDPKRMGIARDIVVDDATAIMAKDGRSNTECRKSAWAGRNSHIAAIASG